jgi:hypothetical protein
MATIPAGLSVGDWQNIRKCVAVRAGMTQAFNPQTAKQLWKLHDKLATFTSPKSKPKTAASPEALSGAEG